MENKEPIKLEFGTSSRLNIPEDAYECKVLSIEEVTQHNKLHKRQEYGGLFTFEIFHGPYKGKQFQQFFTNKVTPRSKLTVLCRAIWGQEFEPEEMAQLEFVNDLRRFLLGKPLKVILLIRKSYLTDTIWYDVAFFCKSEFYDEKTAKVIIPKKK